jgi:superkiller protein 3
MSVNKFIKSFSLILLLTGLVNAQSNSIKRGTELFKQQNYQLAIKEYERVSERNADEYAQAQYNIGVCYYELWRTDDAIAFYHRAIELKHGEYPLALYALGVAYEDQNKLTQAKDAYRNAIESSRGRHPAAMFRLGILFARQGDIKSAAECFKAANKQRGPHSPASHNNLGVMLAQMGKLDEATTEFAEALRLADGKFEDAAYNLKLSQKLRLLSQNRNDVPAFALIDH